MAQEYSSPAGVIPKLGAWLSARQRRRGSAPADVASRPLGREETDEERRTRLAEEATISRESEFGNPMDYLLKGLSPGTLAMFLGPMAKGAPLDRISKAMDLAKRGTPAEDIYHVTRGTRGEPGISFGKEGLPRWETAEDSLFLLNTPRGEIARLLDTGRGIQAPLEYIISDANVYKNYPQLRSLLTTIIPYSGAKPAGYFDRKAREIFMQVDPTYLKGGIAHELQHAIQDIEGFARGGGPGYMQDLARSKASDLAQRYLQMVTEHQNRTGKSWANSIEDLSASPHFRQLREAASKIGAAAEDPKEVHRLYERLAGEVEARNAANRLWMSPEQRAGRAPWETEDIPRGLQILR